VLQKSEFVSFLFFSHYEHVIYFLHTDFRIKNVNKYKNLCSNIVS